MLRDFWHELADEAGDFFEDFGELLFHIRRRPRKEKKVIIGGIAMTVRPAYLFAERIDNFLKVIFAVSIILSAITATFIGFIKLSDLLEVLIFTIPGRVVMMVIGSSYLVTALWRLLKMQVVEPQTSNENDFNRD